MPSAQKLSDEQLLFELQAQIPGLKESLALASIFSNYSASKHSRHPVLNFAFARVGGATIESIALRMCEAVDPYLERASERMLGTSLFSGKGRQRRCRDPELALLFSFRHEMVAHRVKLGGFEGSAFAEIERRHKSPFRFLEIVLERIDDLLSELTIAGLFHLIPLQPVQIYKPQPFTVTDVRKIIAAGNRLAKPR